LSPRNDHPDWNDLAALAEGRHTADPDIHRHLAGCRRCAAAYAEAVRARSRELAAPDSLTVPPDLVQAALAAGPAGSRPSTRPAPRRVRLAGAWGGAVAAMVVAVVVIGLPGGPTPPPEFAAVRVALAGAGADLDDALAALGRRHASDPGPETAYWLASGYLAAGRLDAAVDVIRDTRRHHPDDQDLLILDAAVSYRVSDLGRAETLLREVLVRDPGHAEARFDLAIVLQETGRGGEALRHLESTSWADGSWLARRAAAMRDTIR
jgi:tetratricopeptide (TPR) repeat protein